MLRKTTPYQLQRVTIALMLKIMNNDDINFAANCMLTSIKDQNRILVAVTRVDQNNLCTMNLHMLIPTKQEDCLMVFNGR